MPVSAEMPAWLLELPTWAAPRKDPPQAPAAIPPFGGMAGSPVSGRGSYDWEAVLAAIPDKLRWPRAGGCA